MRTEVGVKKKYMEALDDFWEVLRHRDEMVRYHHKLRYDMITALKGIQRGTSFADLGCGPGILCVQAARRGADVVGLDISKQNLRKEKEMVKRVQLDQISFVLGDVEHLPFRKHSFEVVVCTEVLEHLKGFHGALQEIKMVTKIGGRAIFSVPNLLWVWRWVRVLSVDPPLSPPSMRCGSLKYRVNWRALRVDRMLRIFQRGMKNGFVNDKYSINGSEVSYHYIFSPLYFVKQLKHYFKIVKVQSTLKWCTSTLPLIPISLQRALARCFSSNGPLIKYLGVHLLVLGINRDNNN